MARWGGWEGRGREVEKEGEGKERQREGGGELGREGGGRRGGGILGSLTPKS